MRASLHQENDERMLERASFVLAALLACLSLGCPAPETSTDAAQGAEASGTPHALTAADLMANEQFWPNIVAIREAWTPPGQATPLERGDRGAMIRLTPEGRVRIDFGRHGRHEVPVGATDLVDRANAVRTGELHKVAANFLAHFGTQFLDPTAQEQVPMPTPELAKSSLFLCLFLFPSGPAFAPLAERLASLPSAPRLQMLLFPLGLALEEIEQVKPAMRAAGLLVPFAYPAAAEKHAQSLLGAVPNGPRGLLISPEGRVVLEVDLGPGAAPESIEALRAAIEASPAGQPTPGFAPAITESS
jgi:hypothetical protein